MNRLVLSVLACVLLHQVSAVHGQDTPKYSQQIKPFFTKYCSECHNSKRPRAGLNLETYKAIQVGSDNGSVLTPGKADESPLVLSLEGKKGEKMPPKNANAQPSAAEIAMVRHWVNAGAPFDNEVARLILPTIPSKTKTMPPVTALRYFPDGQRLVIGSANRLLVIDAATHKLLANIDSLPADVTALAISSDGARLAVACGLAGETATLLFFEVPKTNNNFTNPKVLADAHQDVIQKMAFSPDNARLFTAGYDKRVKSWHVAKAKEEKTLTEHSDSVYALACQPNGPLFASAAADRAVKIWNGKNEKLLYTLGESTDWVYALAWHPNGKFLCAGGVDKSLRVWQVSEEGGEVLHSVFAHQSPITHVLYSADGKTLYSASEDRSIKAWDSQRMVERKLFPPVHEAILALALHPNQKQLAVGLFDGTLLFVDAQTGKETSRLQPAKMTTVWHKEQEPNNSPRTGQSVPLQTKISGTLWKTGDVDYFRFRGEKGDQIGVKVDVKKVNNKTTFSPLLELTNANGTIVAQGEKGFLGYTLPEDGEYSLGLRDRDFRGGNDLAYTIQTGNIPVVTSVFPIGIQAGIKAKIEVSGVHLGNATTVTVDASKSTPGAKLNIPLAINGKPPLGLPQIVVGEYPEVRETENSLMNIPINSIANGRISTPNETDVWKFSAKKNQPLIIEVHARRLGSKMDSLIEIVDANNQPVARATLRSLAKTFVTFRDHNSKQGNIRIEAWSELAVNDFIYVGTELLKIKALPTHPDSDCNFFVDNGQRVGYLGTTCTHLSKDEPMYKVEIHPAGTKFSENGFPVVTLYYQNDDGGGKLGRDSLIEFDPPADGEYRVRIRDSRGYGGEDFAYRLNIRQPRPDYSISFSPTTPSVWQGSAIPLTITAERVDGFNGPISVRLENVPPGFVVPNTTIPAGENSTSVALWANGNATSPDKKQPPIKLIAEAEINGKKTRREVTGGIPKAVPIGDIVTTTDQSSITIKPGGRTHLTVRVERRNKFKGRIPINVQGLPHGVRVLDIGLNGILITEDETSRTMEFYCEPWVEPIDHPIVISARREGPNTEHAAKSVQLKIVP